MTAVRRTFVARIRRLAADCSGMTIIEFAIVTPVFLLMVMGLLDLGQLFYARSMLNGAVEEAARSSSLETGDTSAADARVAELVDHIAPESIMTSLRVSYRGFEDVGRPEQWDDANNDGTCTDGEAYTDENGNDEWDEDIGTDDNGGAGDVVIYTVSLTYDRLFKVPLLGGDDQVTIEASSVKKNQPFADQEGYGAEAGTCE